MKTKKIKLFTDQRPFTLVFDYFLETDLLDWNKKIIFIYLKKFSDNNNQYFPSIKTLCRLSQLSNKTVIKALKGLEEKQIIIKQPRKSEQQGYQSNLYTLCDSAELWKCENIEELKIVTNETESDFNCIYMEEGKCISHTGQAMEKHMLMLRNLSEKDTQLIKNIS